MVICQIITITVASIVIFAFIVLALLCNIILPLLLGGMVILKIRADTINTKITMLAIVQLVI